MPDFHVERDEAESKSDHACRYILRRTTVDHNFAYYMRNTESLSLVIAAHQAGLDAQDVMDHSSMAVTRRYLDPRFTKKTQASDILAEWLRNPPPDSRSINQKRKQA